MLNLLYVLPFLALLILPAYAQDDEIVEFEIGALLVYDPLFDDMGRLAAMEIAVNDWNLLHGETHHMSLAAYEIPFTDDPLPTLQEIHAMGGPSYFAGPMTSKAVGDLKEFADANDIILVSPSSSSSLLSIAGDNIFRLVPDDQNQAPVISNLIRADGRSEVVVVQRNDTWGHGMLDGFVASYPDSVRDVILIPAGEPDYADIARILDEALTAPVSDAGADRVAVFLAGFSHDMKSLFHAMAADSTRVNVDRVKWYGPDSITHDTTVPEDPTVGALASEFDFVSTLFEGEETDVTRKLVADLARDYPDVPPPTIISYLAYDAVTILADTYLETGGEFSQMKASIPDVVQRSSGAMGNYSLNAAGDLDGGTYNVYEIVPEGEGYVWRQVITEESKGCEITISLGDLWFNPTGAGEISRPISQTITNTGGEKIDRIMLSASQWTSEDMSISLDGSVTEVRVAGVLDGWTPLNEMIQIHGYLEIGSSFDMDIRTNFTDERDLPNDMSLTQEYSYEIYAYDGSC